AGLVQSFGETPIPVIPFKGSVLAHETYGKLSLRQNYDVDLFIREQDSEKCAAVLANHGFRYDKAFDRAIRYAHEDDGMEVDVHWGFAPRYFHHRADFDSLWARTRIVSLPEGLVRTFGAEDFLVILCLQVMKD